jgi:proline iminopeptidase
MGEPVTTEGRVEVPGGRVWYQIVGADRPGVPLLCLHGGPGMPHDYLEPLADLAASRPVIFYDQLGCGRSDQPDDDSLWTTDRFVEELAVVRDALGLEFGPVTGRLRNWDVTARLGEIAVPALVTGGRHDEARPAHVAMLAEGIRDAELAIFEDSSHLAFIEERESYLRVVADFLARIEARSGG